VGVAVRALRAALYRDALEGETFLRGVRERIERGDRAAALRACEAARGAPLAEILRAGIEALPSGEEGVDAAVDEAMIDWRPDVEGVGRSLVVMARVSALTGLLVAAVSVGRAFRVAEETGGSLSEAANRGFGGALLALCVGVAAMVIAILARGVVHRAGVRTRSDMERAAHLLLRTADSAAISGTVTGRGTGTD
jgi:biopolymer transport protein ExbB/TolQ